MTSKVQQKCTMEAQTHEHQHLLICTTAHTAIML